MAHRTRCSRAVAPAEAEGACSRGAPTRPTCQGTEPAVAAAWLYRRARTHRALGGGALGIWEGGGQPLQKMRVVQPSPLPVIYRHEMQPRCCSCLRLSSVLPVGTRPTNRSGPSTSIGMGCSPPQSTNKSKLWPSSTTTSCCTDSHNDGSVSVTSLRQREGVTSGARNAEAQRARSAGPGSASEQPRSPAYHRRHWWSWRRCSALNS